MSEVEDQEEIYAEDLVEDEQAPASFVPEIFIKKESRPATVKANKAKSTNLKLWNDLESKAKHSDFADLKRWLKSREELHYEEKLPDETISG